MNRLMICVLKKAILITMATREKIYLYFHVYFLFGITTTDSIVVIHCLSSILNLLWLSLVISFFAKNKIFFAFFALKQYLEIL